MVLGEKEGLKIAKKENLKVFMIVRDGDKFENVMTDGFKPYLLGMENKMELIASIAVFALVIAGMSVGYVFMKKPIAGSCGGLNNLDGEGEKTVVYAEGQLRESAQNNKASSPIRLVGASIEKINTSHLIFC